MRVLARTGSGAGMLRRVVVVAAALVATVGTGVIGASAASATPVSRTAVPSIVHAQCIPPFPVAGINLTAYDPVLDPGVVSGEGQLSMADSYCNALLYVDMNTKVCGFWGCNFEKWARSNTVAAVQGDNFAFVGLACRGGTNRYQTHAWDVIPGTTSNPGDVYSPGQPEFTC